MMRRFAYAVLLLLCAAMAGEARAVQPDELLADPKLEIRARELSAGLRCVVCQNQSIDDSDAPLARDLRLLVRERLKAGDSDDQVEAYIVSRYGDFVLLKPPFNAATLLLWLLPALVLAGAGWLGWRTFGGSHTAEVADPVLSPEEEALLDGLLRDVDRPGDDTKI